jgi:hypothetical protein
MDVVVTTGANPSLPPARPRLRHHLPRPPSSSSLPPDHQSEPTNPRLRQPVRARTGVARFGLGATRHVVDFPQLKLMRKSQSYHATQSHSDYSLLGSRIRGGRRRTRQWQRWRRCEAAMRIGRRINEVRVWGCL